MRLCRCGAVVEDRCDRCYRRPEPSGTTAERGYDNRWRRLSERYRAEFPLCQVCESKAIVTPAKQVHHIVKIGDNEDLRLNWDNLLAVCVDCHKWIEDRPIEARRIKDSARDSRAERW